jgi:hypothetical protein
MIKNAFLLAAIAATAVSCGKDGDPGEPGVPGEVGSYWASSAQDEQGDYLNFDPFSQPGMHSDSKACGHSVRCVRK